MYPIFSDFKLMRIPSLNPVCNDMSTIINIQTIQIPIGSEIVS